jgi:hypothetical protein
MKKQKQVTPAVKPVIKPKRLTSEEISKLPEAEFEKITRAAWNKHNSSIYDSDDYIPYWEFYTEQCAWYKRKPVEGY